MFPPTDGIGWELKYRPEVYFAFFPDQSDIHTKYEHLIYSSRFYNLIGMVHILRNQYRGGGRGQVSFVRLRMITGKGGGGGLLIFLIT